MLREPRREPPPESLCTARKPDGSPCRAVRVSGDDRCCFHRPRVPKPDGVIPERTLQYLASLDLEDPSSLKPFRSGMVQHLLAGTLEPHVCKVALEIACSIQASARPKGDAKRSSMADVMASVVATKPPQQDE